MYKGVSITRIQILQLILASGRTPIDGPFAVRGGNVKDLGDRTWRMHGQDFMDISQLLSTMGHMLTSSFTFERSMGMINRSSPISAASARKSLMALQPGNRKYMSCEKVGRDLSELL